MKIYFVLVIISLNLISAQNTLQLQNYTAYAQADTLNTYANGLWYIDGQTVLNTSSNQFYQSPYLFTVTSSGELWTIVNDSNTNYFVQLSTDGNQTLGNYSFAEGTIAGMLDLVSTPSTFINYFYDNGSLVVFDTVQKEIALTLHQDDEILCILNLNQSVAYVTITKFYLVSFEGKILFTTSIYVSGCTGIFSFFNSTIAVASLLTVPVVQQGPEPFFLAFSLEGTTKIQPYYTLFSSMAQVNDTHFIGTLAQYPNFCGPELFTVDSELNVVYTGLIDLGLNNSACEFWPVFGKPEVIYQETFGQFQFTYNYESNKFTNVQTNSNPVFFENGTVVYITESGYFIQNPNSDPSFVSVPVQSTVTTVQNSNDVWTIYSPCTVGSQFKQCYVLEILGSQNILNEYIFASCPCDSQGYVSLKDADYDSEGNLHISYVDYAGLFYYVNQNKSFGPFSIVERVYQGVTITTNVTTGIGYYVGNLLQTIASRKFNLTTGAALSSNTIVASYDSYEIKLNDQYYFVTSSGTSSTTFFIWDVINVKKVTQMTISHSLLLITSAVVPVGFDPSNPDFYEGVIVFPTNYKNFWFFNNKGQQQTYNLPNPVQFYSGFSLNPSTVYIYQEYYGVNIQAIYAVQTASEKSIEE